MFVSQRRTRSVLLNGSLPDLKSWRNSSLGNEAAVPKLTGDTPVTQLVANTVPFLPKNVFVPALGGFEVLLGVALLIGRRLDLVVILLIMHLAGTFLVLVVTPGTAFSHHNPLMLTMVGEFVVKNVVLIAAGLVVATKQARAE